MENKKCNTIVMLKLRHNLQLIEGGQHLVGSTTLSKNSSKI